MLLIVFAEAHCAPAAPAQAAHSGVEEPGLLGALGRAGGAAIEPLQGGCPARASRGERGCAAPRAYIIHRPLAVL
jgi:hypothetical protein